MFNYFSFSAQREETYIGIIKDMEGDEIIVDIDGVEKTIMLNEEVFIQLGTEHKGKEYIKDVQGNEVHILLQNNKVKSIHIP